MAWEQLRLPLIERPQSRRKKKNRGFKKWLGHLIPDKFCLCCGCDRYESLSVDHIVPLDLGGKMKSRENLMFLCKKCNSRKSNQDPLEWLVSVNKPTKKTFCLVRFEKLRQVVEFAVKFHCQNTSEVVAS